MARPSRQDRSKADLKQELKDQLQMLQISCRAYDEGMEAAGKQISTILRVLFHLKGQSRSLLDQLGYRSGKFYSTSMPMNPRNLLSQFPMLVMEMSNEGGRYLPILAIGGSPFPPRLIPFVEWWDETIVKDDRGATFSRMSLISHIANTDGGAHVDPGLEEDYHAFSRENSLGWLNKKDGSPVDGRPHLACMRQIAHEVLLSLHDRVPEFTAFSEPVIPKPRS